MSMTEQLSWFMSKASTLFRRLQYSVADLAPGLVSERSETGAVPGCGRYRPFIGYGIALALVGSVLTGSGKAEAMTIQTVKSPGGIEAWLVEDHSVPLITVKFAFKGGSAQDPDDKTGLSYLLSGMFDEGAGDLKSQQFQEKIDELAIKMSFNSSRDNFDGSFQTLSKYAGQAFHLLKLALSSPRFDQDALDRVRQQIIAGLRFDAQEPRQVASRKWFELAFPGHPYSRPLKGTAQSLMRITPDDLRHYLKRVLARDNLKISVVGDITAAQLAPLLDEVFGGLSATGKLKKIADVNLPSQPVQEVVKMKIPQSVAQFGQRGFKRKDKDFVAAYILNYILGGGGFSSRLMEEVREKRGLAYSIYTYLSPYDHTAMYVGAVATKNSGMAESLRIIQHEFERMYKEGPTQQELDDAKTYLTGSYALRFDTSAKIADQLLWIQVEELGKDYIDKRNDMINAITLQDLKRVARRLLDPKNLVVTIVGQPQLDGDKQKPAASNEAAMHHPG